MPCPPCTVHCAVAGPICHWGRFGLVVDSDAVAHVVTDCAKHVGAQGHVANRISAIMALPDYVFLLVVVTVAKMPSSSPLSGATFSRRAISLVATTSAHGGATNDVLNRRRGPIDGRSKGAANTIAVVSLEGKL